MEPPMRAYEVMLIIDTGLDDQVVQTTIKSTTDHIVKIGGTLGRTEKWGRRKLAYEIKTDKKKHNDGYYTLIEFSAEPAQITELDRNLRLDDGIVRHKVLLVPAKATGRSLAQPPALDDIPSGGGRDRDRD
jgi:small subunit ribosomal protein S6